MRPQIVETPQREATSSGKSPMKLEEWYKIYKALPKPDAARFWKDWK